jgi:Domain of unknown function (DUF4326)
VNLCRTVHCKDQKYNVYIGRPSKWGNPFVVGIDGTRAEVVRKYESWVVTQKHLMDSLTELQGKILGCWCHPQLCHGDVLARLVNERCTK